MAQCRQIVAHGAGNPFFVEELAWHAVEHGLSATRVPLPETVHAVLAGRIDRLPPVAKRLLQTAAIIGHEIPLRLLQALAELSADALQRGLTHPQAAEFLYETSLFPEPAYAFKHALTHEVAYNAVLLERRRVLHERVGRPSRSSFRIACRSTTTRWRIITAIAATSPRPWTTCTVPGNRRWSARPMLRRVAP
jgi:predicted ATPase